ncbi:hypothetical protein GDO78_003346, partial [Eleutherodactylus coqui]
LVNLSRKVDLHRSFSHLAFYHFVLSGNELRIFLADLKATPYFSPKVKLSLESEGLIITSVVPGDYNGDSQMDVLLTTIPSTKDGADHPLSVVIYWGQNQTLSINHKSQLNNTYSDEPHIMDFNGDLVPDIFGVPAGSLTPLITYGGDLTVTSSLGKTRPMVVPHSHAFIDLTGDFTADLFLTTLAEDKSVQFETWKNQGGNFTEATSIVAKPKDASIVGQSVMADFDGDGLQDHLLPVCKDEQCQKSVIYLMKNGSTQWVPVLENFTNANTLWAFVLPDSPHFPSLPIALHMGDYNMDGYPDALVILRNTSGSWSAKLYLTPSNIVLLTAIALIGVCVFILAIIGILHWQEKKADDREKRQEAHRFHFDAM